jgi:hypothetical protein
VLLMRIEFWISAYDGRSVGEVVICCIEKIMLGPSGSVLTEAFVCEAEMLKSIPSEVVSIIVEEIN